MPGHPCPDITVVTVSFNSAATIADTVRSVRAQTGVAVEHLIVDGQSSDDTLEIVRRSGHAGPLISEPDKGIYDAMNKGLGAARGRYVGFLNSDDYFAAPTSLSHLLGALRGGEADAAWGNVMQVDRAGRPFRLVGGKWASRRTANPLIVPPHPSFYARTELLRSLGGFALRYRIASDFDLLIRLARTPSFRGVFLDELTTIMRVGGASANGLRSVIAIRHELLSVLKDNGCAVTRGDFFHRYAIRAIEVASAGIFRLQGRKYLPPLSMAGEL